ncbi:MAG TPA: ATP-binding protein [Streptosporangiaceae bacterium]|nr:ATP-binding protein [Streptosporangiaceae bacterium]
MSGYRLHRLELYNWGTFGDKVWTLDPASQNCLLTGDIGSGKSTVVDAVTTLLLPASRISYNKAAGAETRERSLRSYVLGYYKAERDEVTGATRPVALRKENSYSAILAVFRNEGYDTTVALAQVFWLRDTGGGQPDRMYVTADHDLSITKHLAGFGTEMTALRRRLRASDGVRVFDAFPDYGRDFRRRLGIESEQAMELFHQTVSMKSVGNLTDFVRDHMLQPFDATRATAEIVAHFEDLTKAHEAVQRAQAQLAALTPLLADCDAYDKVAAEIATLTAQRTALRHYFAARKAELLDRLLADLSSERAGLNGTQTQLEAQVRALRERERGLDLQRAGHGGGRLAEIERQVADGKTETARRMERAERYATQLEKAGLDPVETAAQFASRREQIAQARETAKLELTDRQNRLTELGVAAKVLDEQASVVNAELRSLRQRDNNIPVPQLELRDRMCRELGLSPADLPYAGELIAVAEHESDWEGAAERLLRPFALSILVPDRHYAAVSDWIDGHHLGGRVVYYRVPVATGRGTGAPLTGLGAKLDIKDTPFAGWLEHELARRADHECVLSMADFRRVPKAITRAGQFKEPGGRHEKDDRSRIDDRSRYVLGWSNERKIDALLGRAKVLAAQIGSLGEEQAAAMKGREAAIERGQVLHGLDQTGDFTEIDWQSVVKRVEDLKRERDELAAASAELARLDADLARVREELDAAEKENGVLLQKIGAADGRIRDAQRIRRETGEVLAEPGCAAARELFGGIGELLGRLKHDPPATAAGCDRAERLAGEDITRRVDSRGTRRNALASKIVSAMGAFRREYPAETAELDDSAESAAGYRELHKRLAEDDLPRFQRQFKTYLNQNTIRDIATFQSQLNRQAEIIKERIETINASLVDVDYNPGRFIKLLHLNTPHQDVKEFRADLRACTDDTVSGSDSDQYSEQKFLQVSRIIERFRGREGQTEADRKWTRFVTDVRNWYVFGASECWREDGTEHEHYADSSGKSGGQKEKLAYTILAASLAYQFKLEWGAVRSKTFRFTVIDEAFGRGSDESTRFALELFARLGLQLLIVTPLQKIQVIEPYVAAVGYADNRNGNASRLQTMTIEEFRERRLEHALQRHGVERDGVERDGVERELAVVD